MADIMHDAWVEVDLAALRHNAQQVKSVVGPDVALMAVVKGNGFGHGYVEPARAFLEAGAEWLGVTRLDEAMILRGGGITAPLLIMAPIQPENAEQAVLHGVTCAVDSMTLANALADSAQRTGRNARIHLKVDAGMGRTGFLPGQVAEIAEQINRKSNGNLLIEGVFTHFSRAGETDLAPTREQLARFEQVVQALREMKLSPAIRHTANSAATLRLPEARYDLVRVGTLLYGQYPSANVPKNLDLKPTWKYKARVCSVKELPAGSPVGYGAEFVTRRPTRTAVIPVGYADGFTLAPEGPLYRLSPLKLLAKKYKRSLSVTIRGKAAPIIGRVSMQLCVADVTDIPGVEIGDEVAVPALRLATGAHIPRVYING